MAYPNSNPCEIAWDGMAVRRVEQTAVSLSSRLFIRHDRCEWPPWFQGDAASALATLASGVNPRGGAATPSSRPASAYLEHQQNAFAQSIDARQAAPDLSERRVEGGSRNER